MSEHMRLKLVMELVLLTESITSLEGEIILGLVFQLFYYKSPIMKV